MNNQKENTTILRLAGKNNNQFLIDKYEKRFEDDYFLNAYIQKNKIENYWRNGIKKMRINIKEFVQEIKNSEEDWVRERRMEYLESVIKNLFNRMQILGSFVKEYPKDGEILCGNKFKEVKKKYKRFFLEYASLRGDKKVGKEKITEDIIDRCREVDCAQFLDIKKRVGGKSWAICPFHQDTNPSLCCYEEGKGFYCFACNIGGDAITLVEKLYNMEFRDAVNFINNRI